ncbi:MAG TPA: GIY-YIG nuclease family protein [Myxococcaceae bacterium]|nr:GIY-YIG nuclease family protein [Myxococcaceae bacterium]
MDDWCVYILRCGDGSLYTGATNDLEARLRVHRRGRGAAYTRSRLPVRLVYAEPAVDRSAALRREWLLKQLTRPEKLALLRRRRPGASPGRRARPSASVRPRGRSPAPRTPGRR